MKPFVGSECEKRKSFACAYSPFPGGPSCDRDATWHGLRFEEEDDPIGLASCDEHMPVVRELADYVHPHVHPCSIPGSRFRLPGNECFTDWDERSEFARVLTAGAS